MDRDPTAAAPAVRAATHRALAARERLVAAAPEWEAWRRAIYGAKQAMVSRWREYLVQLTRAVEAWGGVVHFAPDAAAARDFILAVARRHGVRRLVQSKSMTAHEIGLPRFLASHGLALTETDLGEYIVQLAGDTPAHLTAPALHLNRRQIAAVLGKSWGREVPADPVALTRLAAARLASCYAEADMGITGVNFAAAAEGVLVCLENEGNLRLTASRPRVHLALMGWDKLIPRLAEVAAGLRLLPPSATGQRLTSLVHFFHGLKAVPDGTQAFYLVILDNGRSTLAGHPELREALFCLRCGACLNVCPVFQSGAAHLYGRVYPGAIGILLAPFLPPPGDLSELCTQCGACGAICPAGIPLPEKIRVVRGFSPRLLPVRRAAGLAGVVLGHPRLYRLLAPAARRTVTLVAAALKVALPGGKLPRKSFWEQNRHRASQGEGEGASSFSAAPEGVLGRGRPDPFPSSDLPCRFGEAGTLVLSCRSPAALARHLAATVRGPLAVEDHPALAPLVRELQAAGVKGAPGTADWAPAVDTAVTRGLAAVPETGSVLVAAGRGPASWLPFRARRQVVVIPAEEGNLKLEEALALTARRDPQVTWLTGPTRTADIEKVLVLGAQGPAALEVVAMSDAEGGGGE
jgi:L-lactate dehydrogenase complex protein LldF